MSKHNHSSHYYNPSGAIQPHSRRTDWIARINTWIRWSFYLLFFAVPLVIYPSTSELFEFNKMWLTFGIGLFILFLWISKIILEQKIVIKRTPLDIPLLLFLLSQFISTIFSIDPHTSWWGYYTRFNGGFLSTVTYIFLFYAFASNLISDSREGENVKKPISYKILLTSLISGTIVALWGFPSHFGYDPTCLVFRGKLDVSCWNSSFQPEVRIFSTLGQPNWMAAYMGILIPISVAFALKSLKIGTQHYKDILLSNSQSSRKTFWMICCLLLGILLYVDLLYTRSQSGIGGFWIGEFVFGALLLFLILKDKFDIASLFKNKLFLTFIAIHIIFLIFTFFIGTGIAQIDKFTYSSIQAKLAAAKSAPLTQSNSKSTTSAQPSPQSAPAISVDEALGGTDSGIIRKYVWEGALEIWQQHPLFGTGVETFAWAYYQVKPAGHNLTSEWDFLYNKAHNEYLNYLATTGIFGLGTYLAFLGLFFWTALRTIQSSKLNVENSESKEEKHDYTLLRIALIGSLISVLISNFFGFSVVIVNLFIFLTPLFFYDLLAQDVFKPIVLRLSKPAESDPAIKSTPIRITLICIAGLILIYFEFLLYWFWLADQSYALGQNLDQAGRYDLATPYLTDAVQKRPGEDLFKDELTVNLSTLALALAQHNEATQATSMIPEIKQLSDKIVNDNPNNVVYFKDRTRVMYSLGQIDPQYLPLAVEAIERAHALAPTDAKIIYNYALLMDQPPDHAKSIELLKQAIQVKPNYPDPYYAIALYYSQMAKAETDPVKAEQDKENGKALLQYFVTHVDPTNASINTLLKSL